MISCPFSPSQEMPSPSRRLLATSDPLLRDLGPAGLGVTGTAWSGGRVAFLRCFFVCVFFLVFFLMLCVLFLFIFSTVFVSFVFLFAVPSVSSYFTFFVLAFLEQSKS